MASAQDLRSMERGEIQSVLFLEVLRSSDDCTVIRASQVRLFGSRFKLLAVHTSCVSCRKSEALSFVVSSFL